MTHSSVVITIVELKGGEIVKLTVIAGFVVVLIVLVSLIASSYNLSNICEGVIGAMGTSFGGRRVRGRGPAPASDKSSGVGVYDKGPINLI